jgi:hypothetical protein
LCGIIIESAREQYEGGIVDVQTSAQRGTAIARRATITAIAACSTSPAVAATAAVTSFFPWAVEKGGISAGVLSAASRSTNAAGTAITALAPVTASRLSDPHARTVVATTASNPPIDVIETNRRATDDGEDALVHVNAGTLGVAAHAAVASIAVIAPIPALAPRATCAGIRARHSDRSSFAVPAGSVVASPSAVAAKSATAAVAAGAGMSGIVVN